MGKSNEYVAPNISESRDETTLILMAGQIALRACGGKYVSADLYENTQFLLKAGRAFVIQSFEIFQAEDAGNGYIALKAFNGKYVQADLNLKNNQLRASADKIGDLEKFKIVCCGKGQIAIQACNGMFVGVNSNKLTACSLHIKEWEMFRWEPEPCHMFKKVIRLDKKLDEIKELLISGKMDESFLNAIRKEHDVSLRHGFK